MKASLAGPPNIEILISMFENPEEFRMYSHHEFFRKWVEAVWLYLNMAVDPVTFKTTLDQYSAKQGAEIATIMMYYFDLVEQKPFEDILGQLFMRLDVKSAKAGQYLTPWSVSVLSAELMFDKEYFIGKVEEQGTVSVCDPAVGSGGMLLAFAFVVNKHLGREYVNKIRSYGQDIDIRCVQMSKIQLRMNFLDRFSRCAALLAQINANASVANRGQDLAQLITIAAAEDDVIYTVEVDYRRGFIDKIKKEGYVLRTAKEIAEHHHKNKR